MEMLNSSSAPVITTLPSRLRNGFKTMRNRTLFRPALVLALVLFAGLSCKTEAPAETTPAPDPLAWPQPTETSRPWSFWWWMGSAVDKENILKELTRYHDAGWGGVHIIPIYGAIGSESKYIDYLSPHWMEMLGYTVTEAHKLGMGVDMTAGTGWCFGGPTVSVQDATETVTAQSFPLTAGQQLQQKFNYANLQALSAFPADGPPVDLLSLVAADGSVTWTAPNSCVVYAVLQKPSAQKVKRAAPGGVGYMLNPIYPPAIQHFLPWFTEAFSHYDGPKPRALFVDSWEYKTDWSPDFFAEFEKRRGYRLQTELPALFGRDASDRAARVKSDYRETISDVLTEETYPAWVDWAHREGFITRFQAHGAPGNLLDLYATADIPETECIYKSRNPLMSKFASSAAHVAGHPLASSETGTWLADHFTETLAEIKYLIDDFYLGGINHIVFHGTCYSPDEAAWPGWCFYASTEMNPRNSIWHDVPALAAYITRCQSVLQEGRPDNDVLVYFPIYDLWHNPKGMPIDCVIGGQDWFYNQPIAATAQHLWSRGYAFDYISDRQLLAAALTDDGRVAVPGGSYRAIVVPPCDHMPVKTLDNLLALAQGGVTVIFENHLPTSPPGLSDFDHATTAFNQLLAKVKLATTRIRIGDIEKALAAARIPRESMTDHPGLLFVRRSIPGGHAYFIANRGTTAINDWITLSVRAQSIVAMDPLTGQTGVSELKHNPDGTPQLHLQIEAGQSLILRSFTDKVVQGAPWIDWQPDGSPIPLTGTWQVNSTQGGPTLPASFQTDKLGSWTDQADPEAQRFAGSATYSISFDAPSTAAHWSIDLGQVCQSARVKLNGQDLGTVFTAPFRVSAGSLLPKGNHLEVEVTNVSANRIRDLDQRGVKWKIFHDLNIVSDSDSTYLPFDASHWPLTPSGLLGPVTLCPEKPFPSPQ